MTSATAAPRQFPCRQCGASLVFAPGLNSLKCPYCNTLNEITQSAGPQEIDYENTVAYLADFRESRETLTVRCDGCGAESQMREGQTAGECPFCGRALVATAISKRVIKPNGVVPFVISDKIAKDTFAKWLAGRWFAPSSLKTHADRGGLRGIYLPAWTYDARADTTYTGQRGDDYTTTESYTAFVNGKHETRTRTVTRTRWSYRSGAVEDAFDDVFVLADRSVPDKLSKHLWQWDLNQLKSYDDQYLAGFVAESYQVDLEQGFQSAQSIMEQTIRNTICRDIGGDHQQISSMNPIYTLVTFKHMLVPVWLSAYRYGDRTFQFIINAQTGTVRGERPYSAWKITFFVLSIVIAVILLVTLIGAMKG